MNREMDKVREIIDSGIAKASGSKRSSASRPDDRNHGPNPLRLHPRGGKVIFFGNGGSAADAQHLAAELSGRLYLDRPSLPAVSLSTNSSALTAVAMTTASSTSSRASFPDREPRGRGGGHLDQRQFPQRARGDPARPPDRDDHLRLDRPGRRRAGASRRLHVARRFEQSRASRKRTSSRASDLRDRGAPPVRLMAGGCPRTAFRAAAGWPARRRARPFRFQGSLAQRSVPLR